MEGDTGPSEVSHPAVVPLYAPPHRFSRPDVSTSSHPQPFDENDPRVYFDRSSNTWKCEDNSEEEASEMEWDANAKAWIAILDDDLIKAQQQAYSVEGVDEEVSLVLISDSIDISRAGLSGSHEEERQEEAERGSRRSSILEREQASSQAYQHLGLCDGLTLRLHQRRDCLSVLQIWSTVRR